jgi:Cu+-exporting ATPase
MHPTDTAHEVDLDITGMTCASCSSRIERKLNKIEGVEAVVNLPLEKATVTYAAPVTVEQLLGTVTQLGYGASVVRPEHASRAGERAGVEDAGGEHADGHGHDSGTVDHLAHDVAPEEALKRRALISLVLTVPVVILAMVPGIHIPGNAWVQLALTTPVVMWAAWPFHRAAAINARHLASTMDTLVSLGVLAAYLWSTVAVLTGTAATMGSMGGGAEGGRHLYFETAAVITTFLLIGRWMEARAKDQGRSALTSLLTLGARDVAVRRADPATGALTERRIPVDELAAGETFVVRPGEKVATDGRVVIGRSSIDTSLVTGESVPVEVGPGDEVTGGTINGEGLLTVEATRVGSETTLAGIARLVERAQTGKAPIQRLADRVSAVFVPVVLGIAALTFLGWWIGTGDPARALGVAIAVLVIACPCALGLATPTALLVGTGRGAQLGILIKGPQVLEDTRRIDTIVLDKTGTVTVGRPVLVDVTTAGRLGEDSALRAAAAVEAGSEHPIAHAVLEAARSRGLDIPPAEDFRALTGAGALATVGGTEVVVGKAELFTTVPEELTPRAGSTGTTIWVGWADTARAMLTVADEARPSSRAAIGDLVAAGLTPHLLTGDRQETAEAVARAVGIDPARVTAQVAPADKHAVIEALQRDGHVVAMVGDGVNDAAALARADLGIAMGTGTDVAADSADIVLMRSELPAVVDAIGLSRATLRVIKQNLAWAFGYNVAAIPLAVAGLLNPMIAGAAMAMSSVLVVTNSLRLRRYGR